jgi:transposase-like protein
VQEVVMDSQGPDSPAPTPATTDTAEAPVGGGRSSRVRLSTEQERELARLYAETRTPPADLARRFGVSQTSVMRIARRHGGTRGGSRRSRGSATTSRPTRAVRRRATTSPTTSATQPGRRFRVRFLAEQVVEAADMRDAVARAEALGAVEISSIALE